MAKQDEAFINLFNVILEENNYYEYLKRVREKYPNFASNLYWRYDKRQPISVYGFLDSIEDYIAEKLSDNDNPTPDDILEAVELAISDLDEEGGWKD